MNPQQGMRDALDANQTRAWNVQNVTAQNAGLAQGAMIGSFTDLAQAGFTAWMNRRGATPSTGTGGGWKEWV